MSLRQYPLFDQVGLMSVGHECLSLMISSELVFEPQLDQKKLSTPSFLHCRAESGSRGPFPIEFECTTSQFYARSHALICTCPKNGVPAPHSTSSPHLAQTEQVRLMRFFCIAGLQHLPKGHNQCFGACGSEPNGHSAGAICHCDR